MPTRAERDAQDLGDLAHGIVATFGEFVEVASDMGLYDESVADAGTRRDLRRAWAEHARQFPERLDQAIHAQAADPALAAALAGAGLVRAPGAAKGNLLRRLWKKIKGTREPGTLRKLVERWLGLLKSILNSLKELFGMKALGPWAEGVGELVDFVKAILKEK